MKKISILLFFIGVFLLNPNESAALKLQVDTTTNAIPDDLVFTTVGSAEDSAANNIKADTVKKTEVNASTPIVKEIKNTEVPKTLWQTFIEGLLGGFLAFLMPCIFPMVPLTVSYFTKRAGSKQECCC